MTTAEEADSLLVDGPSTAPGPAARSDDPQRLSSSPAAMASSASAPGSSKESSSAIVSRHSSGFPVEKWVEKFKRRPPEILSEVELKGLCQHIKDILAEENNVQPVPAPVTICGDIHGQFYDLLALFEVGGQLPEHSYIFLGDYVDRGHNSVETFQYLLILKLMYPSRVTLLRGNHESRQITQVYGFYDECVRKYGNSNPWKYCTDLFDYLTLAAVVDQRIFCVHGGLSPAVKLVDQLRVIHRTQEIPHEGPFGDIVWSDPDDFLTGWAVNPRGAGWLFGGGITREFNRVNDFDLIARAHQLAMDGYKYAFGPDNPLVTVWSAPNYCYRCGNVAAIMRVDRNYEREFIMFKETPESNMSNQATVPYFL